MAPKITQENNLGRGKKTVPDETALASHTSQTLPAPTKECKGALASQPSKGGVRVQKPQYLHQDEHLSREGDEEDH